MKCQRSGRSSHSARLSPASGWRFSPTSVTPRSARIRTSLAGKNLVTATRVTSPGSRPAAVGGVGDPPAYGVETGGDLVAPAAGSRRDPDDARLAPRRAAVAAVGEEVGRLAGARRQVDHLDAVALELGPHARAHVEGRRTPRGGGPAAPARPPRRRRASARAPRSNGRRPRARPRPSGGPRRARASRPTVAGTIPATSPGRPQWAAPMTRARRRRRTAPARSRRRGPSG